MLRRVYSASIRAGAGRLRARSGRGWPIVLSGLSALALGIFLWQNDLGGMWRSLAKADPLLVLLALALFLAHHVVRAARWRMLLSHLHDCGDWLPLRAMTVGVAINNVAPAKAGHFARAQIISTHSPINRLAVGSSFLLEALFDGLLVLLFVGVALAFVPVGPEIRTSAAGFAVFMLLMLGLAGMVATGRVPARRVQRPLRAAAAKLPLPARLRTAASGSGQHLRDGAGALRDRRRVIDVAITSVVAYTLLAWSFFLLARGLQIQLSFAEAIAVVAVANLATALPGAGGGIGTFEVITAHTVAAMGVGDAAAAAYTVALHALIILPITLLGIAFIAVSSRTRADDAEAGDQAGEAVIDSRFARGLGRLAAIPRRAA